MLLIPVRFCVGYTLYMSNHRMLSHRGLTTKGLGRHFIALKALIQRAPGNMRLARDGC